MPQVARPSPDRLMGNVPNKKTVPDEPTVPDHETVPAGQACHTADHGTITQTVRLHHREKGGLPVITVGLTGGIGSGKSEVSRLLAARGAVVVDADLLAREVVEPGTAGLADVLAAFSSQVGPGLVGADGRLDRAALGRLVFADADARRRLESIVHPLVGARAAELVAAADAGAVVVYDVPLLVENHLAPGYDCVVVVDASDQTRLDRLAARGLGRADAIARMAAQACRDERLAAADYVLLNDGTLPELDRAVDALWAHLRALPTAR